jgi:hypothetical protein
MTHFGTLRDFRFTNVDEVTDDIRGANVYGLDDKKLGKIDDVIFDHATGSIRYVVVDTGGWLSSKKFIVPPYQLSQSTQHEDDFQVHLTREQIESFPPYNEADVESDERWNDYEGRYRSQWEEKPVMHRVATDRNITPTTKQQIDAGSGTLAGAESDSDDDATASDVTPMRTETSLDVDPSGPSRRWNTFEDRLRKRRDEIISACSTCKTSPASETGQREARRKAS